MRRGTLLLAVGLLLPSCESTQRTAPSGPEGKKETAAPSPQREAPPPLQVAAWLNSEPRTLAELKGRVVVLDFWNTTCGPCRELVPHLAQLYEKHKAEGLVVIGISEEEKADLEKFLKKIPIPYPLAVDTFDGTGQTFDAYGIGGVPTACLIGRDGSVVWKGPGAELTDERVLAELAR